MNKSLRQHRASILGMALSAIAAFPGGPPMPKHLREVFQPRRPDDPHTGDSCPKCKSFRVWISGETLRCRDCGTRFIPDDLPPAEETAP
jgi:hypothetical protein